MYKLNDPVRRVTWRLSVIVILLALILGMLVVNARSHEAHGVNYNNWVNGLDKGCCNNQDCRAIGDDDVKYSPTVVVQIEGQWCPVLSHHYLKKGNAPDWSSSHVCVQVKGMYTPEDPCARLLCFQPKPLF